MIILVVLVKLFYVCITIKTILTFLVCEVSPLILELLYLIFPLLFCSCYSHEFTSLHFPMKVNPYGFKYLNIY